MKYVSSVGLWFGRGFLVILLFLLPASIFLTVGLTNETYSRISQSIILLDSLQKQTSQAIKITNQTADGTKDAKPASTFELFSQLLSQSSDQAASTEQPACSQEQISSMIAQKVASSEAKCNLSEYDKALVDHENIGKDYENLQATSQTAYQFQDLDNSGGELSGTTKTMLKAITIARMSLLIVIIILVLAVAGLYAAVNNVPKFLQVLAKALVKVGIILVAYAAAIFVLIKMHFLSMIMNSTDVRTLEDMLGQYSLTGVQINLVVGIVYIAIAIAFFKLSRSVAQYQKAQDILKEHQPVLMYNKSHD